MSYIPGLAHNVNAFFNKLNSVQFRRSKRTFAQLRNLDFRTQIPTATRVDDFTSRFHPANTCNKK